MTVVPSGLELTFILIDLEARGAPFPADGVTGEDALVAGMCGDVNLFLNDHDDRLAAEIEIMVAEPGSRRKGIAREALLIMMHYSMAW